MGFVRVLAACLAMLLSGPTATAGPWERSAGDVFLSFGTTLSQSRETLDLAAGAIDPDPGFMLYSEVGLGHRLTFGLDLHETPDSALRTVFLRRTFTGPDAPWQLAADLGAVQSRRPGADDTLLRLGVSVGRGFGPGHMTVPISLDHAGGWMVVDAFALIDPDDTSDPIWKIDAMVGLRLSDQWRLTSGLVVEDWGQGTMISAHPSVILGLGPATHLQIGGVFGIDGTDTMGLTVKLWQEF